VVVLVEVAVDRGLAVDDLLRKFSIRGDSHKQDPRAAAAERAVLKSNAVLPPSSGS
jgi:hypothetical protein